MRAMLRSLLWLVIGSFAVLLSACDPCQDARRDAVRAWDNVVGHALDVAAEWGEIEVRDSSLGPHGMSDTAARERKRWAAALEKAKAGRDAMATFGPDFLTTVNQTYDTLSVMEPPRAKEDWKAKLSSAKRAAYLAQTVCRKPN